MKFRAERPQTPPAGSAPACSHAGMPRVVSKRYWARSRLWTVKELVCAGCGKPLRPPAASGG